VEVRYTEKYKMDDIYSTEEEVKEELKRRWADKDLEKKLFDFLNGNIPEPFLNEPRAILPRQLATPDNEYKTFYNKAIKLGIKPLSFEFHDDVFITTNHGKACLGKMVFYHGVDKNSKPITTSVHSIDLTGINENKPLRDISTLWGENFVDFHHRILKKNYDTELYDGSWWYKINGGEAKKYYIYYIALLTIRNVLFENLETGREDKFFNDVFFPALEYVKKYFGLKPLIMPIAPADDIDNKYWWCYPENIKSMIQ
jgi:hypothetical protein